jgi:hypothetical protein
MRFADHSWRFGFALALVAVIFSAAFAWEAHKNPLRGDEVDFFQCIANARDHGRVLYYAGEVPYDRSTLVPVGRDRLGSLALELFEFEPSTQTRKGNHFALAGTSRYTYCLWHPPLYVATTALVAHLLPLEPARAWLVRLANWPLLLLMAVACFACASALYPERKRQTTLVALVLLALSSLWLRGSTLVDYAGALAPTAALLVVLSVTRLRRGHSLLAGLGLALPWFASFGVSVAMLIAAFTAALLTRDFRYVARLALHAVAGFVLFSAVFFVWAQVAGFSFAEPYVYNFLFRGGNSHGIKPWRSVVLFARYALESGVSLSALFALLAYLALRRPGGLAAPAVVLVTGVLVAFGMHAFLRVDAYGFSKYVLYALPLMALFVAGELLGWLEQASVRARRLGATALGVMALEGAARGAVLLSDPLPDLYLAGQAGFGEMAALAREASAKRDVILADKDLAFAAERKFIGFYGPLTSDPELLTRELARHQVRLFAVTTRGLNAATPAVRELLRRRFPRTLAGNATFQLWQADDARTESERALPSRGPS